MAADDNSAILFFERTSKIAKKLVLSRRRWYAMSKCFSEQLLSAATLLRPLILIPYH